MSMRCALALSSVVLLASVGCRRVPAEYRPIVESHRSAAQQLAQSAGARCNEVRNTGIQGLLGNNPASPAQQTPLANDPEVVDVNITCLWPNPAGGGGTGNSFARLHPQAPQNNHNGTYDAVRLDGSDNEHTLEEVSVPSIAYDFPRTIDLTVQRPAPGGGWVIATVTLRPR